MCSGREALTSLMPEAEFDRQLSTLISLGYPALAGLTEDAFRATVGPLRPVALEAAAPYVLVISPALVAAERAVPLLTLAGATRPGVVDRNFAEGDLARFTPQPHLGVPDEPAYLVLDVERGEEFGNVKPDDAVATIAARGRTPLTIAEGIALVTHHPELLVKNKCFSLAGSRCGDRRVPALWISQGAPKLGWCFAGVPHTWLGCASAGARRSGA